MSGSISTRECSKRSEGAVRSALRLTADSDLFGPPASFPLADLAQLIVVDNISATKMDTDTRIVDENEIDISMLLELLLFCLLVINSMPW